MSTRHSYSNSASIHHVVAAFCHSLKLSLIEQCTERYDVEVTVECNARVSNAETGKVTCELGWERTNLLSVPIEICFVGGTVYDLEAGLADGPTWRQTYSLPSSTSTSVNRMPNLGEQAATFFLNDLERKLGSDLLQTATGALTRRRMPAWRQNRLAPASQERISGRL